MKQQAIILEFPFYMNWIATVRGGAGALEIFWDTVNAMNSLAASGLPATDIDRENIEYLNDIFVNWNLPVFPINYINAACPSLSKNKVIPFPT